MSLRAARRIAAFVLLALAVQAAHAAAPARAPAAPPRTELLWPKGAPGQAPDARQKDKPTLTTFLPPRSRATRSRRTHQSPSSGDVPARREWVLSAPAAGRLLRREDGRVRREL